MLSAETYDLQNAVNELLKAENESHSSHNCVRFPEGASVCVCVLILDIFCMCTSACLCSRACVCLWESCELVSENRSIFNLHLMILA